MKVVGLLMTVDWLEDLLQNVCGLYHYIQMGHLLDRGCEGSGQ